MKLPAAVGDAEGLAGELVGEAEVPADVPAGVLVALAAGDDGSGVEEVPGAPEGWHPASQAPRIRIVRFFLMELRFLFDFEGQAVIGLLSGDLKAQEDFGRVMVLAVGDGSGARGASLREFIEA